MPSLISSCPGVRGRHPSGHRCHPRGATECPERESGTACRLGVSRPGMDRNERPIFGGGGLSASRTWSVQVMQSNLDRFVSSQPAASSPIISFTSQEVRDRKSAFVAYIFPATEASQVRNAVAHIRRIHANRPPAHEVAAWRFMALKPGMTGLGGEGDFEVVSAYDDDGEKWAGGRVLNLMKQTGVMDAVVVVSRWWVHALACCGQG